MTTATTPPLLTQAQATALLELVLAEQVLECVDLAALYRVEQSLVFQLGEVQGLDEDQATVAAQAMIERALLGLPDKLSGFLRAAGWPMADCALCAMERDDDDDDDGHSHRPDELKPKPGPRQRAPARAAG